MKPADSITRRQFVKTSAAAITAASVLPPTRALFGAEANPVKPKQRYLSDASVLSVGETVNGPARVLELKGRKGINPQSIHTAIKLVGGHTLNEPKGTLVLWFFALEDLAASFVADHMKMQNEFFDNYTFLSDFEMPRDYYAPAGAYSEGPDYWAYGTTFYALMAEALRTTFGTTCDLERAPGFLQTADYTLQMTAPSGALFNFADNGSGIGLEPIMFWFARELRRADLTQRDLTRLKSLAEAVTAGTSRDDGSRMMALALLWREPSLATLPPSQRALTWWSAGGSQPQAVMRSAWGDPRATFVGIKAGCADDSHAHMDIGSFILEANGLRWAVDLGRESYPHARANGIANAELFSTKQDSKRWSIFRCGPESHNLLRFDNAPPRVEAKADIHPMADGEGAPGFIVDLSPVVRDQVASAHRQFKLHPNRSVAIDDEWTTGAKAANVTWQWLTRAQVTVTADGAILRQQGETLRLRITEGKGATVEVEDVSRPRQAWDSPNAGLSRILIHMRTPPGNTGRLRVLAEPSPSPLKP